MTKITKEDVLKLARLAKLQLTDEEIEQFSKEFTEILNYVQQLQSVKTDDLEPTYQVTGLKNVTRKDVVKDYGVSRAELLKNVPQTEDGFIKVRRMLA